jgi:hypothetical protein
MRGRSWPIHVVAEGLEQRAVMGLVIRDAVRRELVTAYNTSSNWIVATRKTIDMRNAVCRVVLPSRETLVSLAITVALLAAAGIVRDGRQRHSDALDLSRFGEYEDVDDSLVRDEFVATELLPLDRGAAPLSWGAVAAFLWAAIRGPVGLAGLLAGIASLASAVWLSFVWAASSFFAG